METILERLETLLELKRNFKYQRAVRTLLDKDSNAQEKKTSKKDILKELAKVFSKDERIADEYKEDLGDSIFNILGFATLSDDKFVSILEDIEARTNAGLREHYMDAIATLVKSTSKDLECEPALDILKGITEDSTPKDIERITEAAIGEIIKSMKADLEKSKRIPDESKTELNGQIDELQREIIESINADDADMKSTYNETKTFLKSLKDIHTDIKKELKAKPKKFSLKREPKKGKLKSPYKGKGILKKIGIGAAAVAVSAGIIVGGISLFSKLGLGSQDLPEDPSVSDPVDPDTTQTPDAGEVSTEEALAEVEADAAIVFENWSKLQSPYNKETIIELMKCLRGMESTMTIDVADEILLEMLNIAIYPGINNALVGHQYYETSELDFASLLSERQQGLKAVENMEDALNGMLTDQENMSEYAQSAFEDQAFLIGEEKTVDGLNVTQETTVDPGVRLVWSRLAIGANGLAGTLGEDYVVEVDGKVYTQSEINDASALEDIAKDAKQEMGYTPNTLKMN